MMQLLTAYSGGTSLSARLTKNILRRSYTLGQKAIYVLCMIDQFIHSPILKTFKIKYLVLIEL